MGSLSSRRNEAAMARRRLSTVGMAVIASVITVPLFAGAWPARPSLPVEQPVVRVAVAVDRAFVTVSSPAGLRLTDALTGQPAGDAAAAGSVQVASQEGVLRFAGELTAAPLGVPSVVIRPADPGAPIIVDGTRYRGHAEVRASGSQQVTAINVLPLEDYLLGVVPLEIGPRTPAELAAVEAQAVAARTYAVAHLGRYPELGFDFYGTVQDQVYGGLEAELGEATRAVRNTAGLILMFDGRPIRAFYHSTCGGRTAPVEEVMDREPAPYLQSVSDQAPDGSDYCSISPRYRWSVAWTPEELDAKARAELGAHFGMTPGELPEVRSVEVVSRTRSGRVEDLAFRGPGMELVLSRLDIRRALPSDARILSSTDFTVQQTRDGLVKLHGRGYGHGAGMCQWGAIGRARTGQTYQEILAAYYRGAALVNVYAGEQE